MAAMKAVARNDFEEITGVWEASVRATHAFLTEADIAAYKALFPACLGGVDLFCVREQGRITGFIGIVSGKVEMLFIHPAHLGKGLGKALMRFAMETHGVNLVDVNEENAAAAEFYFRLGFEVTGRSAEDGLGKPHPLLHLKLRP